MTIYTLIGDPHAKPDNLDKINRLFDIVEDLGNAVIWLGDLLDTKEVVRGRCLNTYLKRFSNSKLNHFVVVGNHDWFNLECKEHSLESLKVLKNVTVVDSCLRMANLCLVPYLPKDHPEFLKALDSANQGTTLICHADIKSFDYGNGLISSEGLEVSDFKNFRSVISGHYHKYQKLDNITYLGTPFSHSFGESNQDKFIGTYNSVTDKLDLLDSPFPKHVTIELDSSKHSGHYYNNYDYFRVILKGTQEDIDRIKREEGIRYIEQPTNVLKKSIISESMTTEAQFALWAKEIKGYTVDVVDLGLEILKNV